MAKVTRTRLILRGYAKACAAAYATMSLDGVLFLWAVNNWRDGLAVSVIWLLGVLPGLAIMAASTSLPALAAIACAERWSLRSWPYHVAAGICIGMVAGYGLMAAGGVFATTDAIRYALYGIGLFILPGACGGFVYWLSAGRSAGGGPAPSAMHQLVQGSVSPWSTELIDPRIAGRTFPIALSGLLPATRWRQWPRAVPWA